MYYTAFLASTSITHDKMQDKPPLITGFHLSFRQEALLLLFPVIGITLRIILTLKAALKLTKALTKRLDSASPQLAALVGLAVRKIPKHQTVKLYL